MALKKVLFSGVATLAVAAATVVAGEVDLEGVKCVVAPRAAKMDKSAEYKEGKVFFCCGNCQAKFKADKKKFATSANKQLVSTEQYEQKACPFSGQPVDEEMTIKVAGAKVAFCCGNCKGKAEAASEEKQLVMIFSEKPFKKGFEKAEEESDE